jgi:hypothetical protein
MRLEREEVHSPQEPADISAWLLTLKKVLRLPDERAAGILDELEDHLQQRTRDLQVAGHSDAESVRLALNELGDAATLARRFRSVDRSHKRRLVMNIAALGIACSAAIFSAIAIGQGSQDTVLRAYIDQRPQEPTARITLGSGEVALGGLAEQLGKDLAMPVHVHWGRLETYGVARDSLVTIVGKDLSMREIFRRINESLPEIVCPLDYRAEHGALEIADREFFDRRERYLATYDISPILGGAMNGPDAVRDEIREAIVQFVSENDWRDNGGDLAALSFVESTLFIDAPPRMHRQVEWILKQLSAPRGAAPRAGEARTPEDRVERVYPLSHIAAGEALETLKRLQAIREVDLFGFVVDDRTNALIWVGSAAAHDRILGALAVIDRRADLAALKR